MRDLANRRIRHPEVYSLDLCRTLTSAMELILREDADRLTGREREAAEFIVFRLGRPEPRLTSALEAKALRLLEKTGAHHG